MNKLLRISATVDHPSLLENTVKKLAHQHNARTYSDRFQTGGWQSFNSSTIETFVNGNVVFETKNNRASSFATTFLFTCVKQKDSDYKLSWSLSLS